MDAKDLQLIQACRAGEEAARQRLYAAHAGRVMAYLLRSGFARADADDLLQETFLRVFRSLGTFDPAKGAFAGWLGAIARNVARRRWARRTDAERFDPELAEDTLLAKGLPDGDPASREEMGLLRAGIAELPEELRRVLELRYVEGLTTRAVGESAGLPEATVRRRLQEAFAALRARLRAAGVTE